jgi:hypothetical protein
VEQSVKHQKMTKARISVEQPTRKPLSVLYAEVLRLRKLVQQTEAEQKRPQADRRASR